MKKRFNAAILIGILIIGMLSGCGNSSQENAETIAKLEENPDKETEETSGADSEAASLEAAEEAAVKAAEEEANTYYDQGRACLYGLDGHKIDFEEAYASFEKALELGKTEANFYLGVLYDWYGYPKKDYETARTYYEAAGDNPYAWLSLGNLYYYGQGVEEDTAKGQELFEAVIAEGCTEGYLGRGEIAMTDEDYDTALECYNKVLEGEEQIYLAVAMYYIANIYYSGEGVEQDYAKAMEWFEKSADLGYSNAMNGIGYMYHYGEGVEQDYAKAMEWLVKSADLRDSNAMNQIAYIYYSGEGVEQDYAKAMEWFEKSADLGDSIAMVYIAYMYGSGEGVEQDLAKAIEWYEKSADLDNTDAMGSLGAYYLATQEYAKALGWFEKAADLGNADAMDVIASMYENGIGVARNSEKAQEWRDKAEEARE